MHKPAATLCQMWNLERELNPELSPQGGCVSLAMLTQGMSTLYITFILHAQQIEEKLKHGYFVK